MGAEGRGGRRGPEPRFVRLRRALRSEILKASGQPTLLVYFGIVLLTAAAWGPIQYSIARGQEAELRETTRDAPAFGEAPSEPAPADVDDGRGANGFLVLAASMRAGVVVAAILLLLFASTLLAGEGTAGTFRMVLVRPITRTDLILAKAGLLLLLVVAALLAISLVSGALGFLVGGYGDYVDVRYGQVDYTAGELARTVLLSLSLAPLALLAVGAFGLFWSSLFESASAAVTAATLAGIAALAVNLGLGREAAQLNLFTYVDRYFEVLQSFSGGLSEHRFDARLVVPGLLVPGISALVFLVVARTMFARRDIHA